MTVTASRLSPIIHLAAVTLCVVTFAGGRVPIVTVSAAATDPFEYCEAAVNLDAPDTRWKGDPVPDTIVRRLIKELELGPGVTGETVARSASWRCMNGKVYGCWVGANLPCGEKADSSRSPNAGMKEFCAANLSADVIPAAAAGRATIYSWRCTAGRPTIVKQVLHADPRGFIAEFWHRLEPPPKPAARQETGSTGFPPIGIVDFYGLRRLTEEQVRGALRIAEGATIPGSEDDAKAMIETGRRRLLALPGVRNADISPICCDAGRTILYVGIVEKGGEVMAFGAPPSGLQRLPEEVVRAGTALETALMAAVRAGDTSEDDSKGHALSANPAMRAIEEEFVRFAARDEAQLREVLAHSADPAHRALAAQVLGYAADKRAVVEVLARAMADPNANVRNNAMRALAIILGYAAANPRLGIHVDPVPFVNLLNSPFWTDRNKASFAVEEMSRGRDPALLATLRARALPSLMEMARWKSRMHAGFAFFTLGRVAGLDEDAIRSAWERDDRDLVTAAAARKQGRRHFRPVSE